MNETISAAADQIEQDGFAILKGVFAPSDVTQWLEFFDGFFKSQPETIKNRQGAVYAARNVLSAIPQSKDVASLPILHSLLSQILGEQFGVVRGLYFDKHPERTWTLPWHKDLTIAVKDNSLPTEQFTKPTRKNGVPHVEASEAILSRMLTLRIHLDRVTEENGPLEVAVGSHANGKTPSDDHHPIKILVEQGDVLAMRPMLSHASGSSTPGTSMHRRILHLEYAAEGILPDNFEWFQFFRPSESPA